MFNTLNLKMLLLILQSSGHICPSFKHLPFFNYCPTGGGLVQQRRDQPQRRVEEVHGH